MLEGVAFGFPVTAAIASPSGDTDIKNTTRSPDIGLVIAGGLPVTKRVSVEFRYEGGFTQISTDTTGPVQRNRSLSGILRIRLP